MNPPAKKCKAVSISSLVTAAACPLRLYYAKSGGSIPPGRYEVCRQLSEHLGSDISRETIWNEICAIYPDIEPEYLGFLDTCIGSCRKNVSWTPPDETDVPVKSDTFGIYGIVDKLYRDEPYFSIVRSSPAPAAGIYHSDRLRITAYTFCLQELFGEHITGGLVEYIPDGIARQCIPQPIDRRRFIRALHSAKKVIDGTVPAKPSRAPCTWCRYSDRCVPGGTRLSDLL